jgi:citrate synthase
VLNSLLVSLVEHGTTPSTIAARMTYFGAPESLQGAIAVVLLGLGSVFVGTIEGAARMLQEDMAGDTSELADEERPAQIVSTLRADRRQIPDLATRCTSQSIRGQCGSSRSPPKSRLPGRHCSLMKAVHRAAEGQYGRPLTLNVTGAVGAIGSDLQISLQLARGIGVAARSVGLIAHLRAEQQAPTANGIWHDVEEAEKAAAV